MAKSKFGVILLVLSALVLSGCSNPSDAAYYKDGSISIKRLQESISAVVDERVRFNTTPQDGLTGEALTLNLLEFHVVTALLSQAAKERKVSATLGEIAARRAEILKNVGSEDQLSLALVNAGIASIDFNQYLSLIVLQDKLRIVIAPTATDDAQVVQALQKMLEETASKENLKINPRYGVWNTQTNKIDPVDATGGAKSTATK